MGIIIDFHQVADEEAMLSRLLVYMRTIQRLLEPKSVSKELADGLLACKSNRRSMKLEQIFNTVLDWYPNDVTIKDIDVMFNPEYKVDVLKNKNYQAIVDMAERLPEQTVQEDPNILMYYDISLSRV